MNLQLIAHHQINKEKWDACISQSTHPLITAESWYLDISAPGWYALVADDYSAVMPLPNLKKGPFLMCLQPLFIQQLGIFAKHELTQYQADVFYKQIKNPFLFLNLNSKQPLPKSLKLKPAINFILPLSDDYASIYNRFSENCKRNIKKTARVNNQVNANITPENFIVFSKNNVPYSLTPKNWLMLKKIIEKASERDQGFILASTDQENSILAVAFFLKYKNRITFLSGASSPLGIKSKAMFQIMNQIIVSNCKKPVILDFEGSSIKNIARFYKGFGSIPEPYYTWQSPFMMFLLKAHNYLNIWTT